MLKIFYSALVLGISWSQPQPASAPVAASAPQVKTEATAPCVDCQFNQNTKPIQVLPTYADSSFGTCAEKANDALTPNPWYYFLSPKKPYQQLQDAWQNYNLQMNTRVKANSQLLDSELHISKSPEVFLAALDRLNPVMRALDELNGDGILDKLKKYPGFKATVGTNYFMAKVRDFDFADQNSEIFQSLSLQDNPKAVAAMKVIQDTLKDPSNFRVMEIMVKNNLGIVDNASRVNAEALRDFMNSQGITYDKIQTWRQNPPLMKDLPYPDKLTGPFADSYKKYVQADVNNFLMNHQIDPNNTQELSAITKAMPGITLDGIKQVNAASTPTDGAKTAYDDWIHPLHKADGVSNVMVNGKPVAATPAQLEAIDAVTRTLWGEGQSCAAQGLPQFEAIGRVICERAQDVARAQAEKSKVDITNAATVKAFNSSFFGTDEVSRNQLLAGLSTTHLLGFSDFGRADAPAIDPNIQVISKPMQFSIWNSSRYENTNLAALNTDHSSNIPNINIQIQKPQGAGDDNALLNVVCPAKAQLPALWDHALQLAKQIVLTPNDYLKNYRFDTPAKDILFYTHAMDLPFAKEVPISNFIMPPNNKSVSLRENPPGQVVHGSCGQFRLFAPANGGSY